MCAVWTEHRMGKKVPPKENYGGLGITFKRAKREELEKWVELQQ